jgi:hypothetical protein
MRVAARQAAGSQHGLLPIHSVRAPSFETIEQMAKRLRVPGSVRSDFSDARPSSSSR